MMKKKRIQQLVDLLRKSNRLTSEESAAYFGVSLATIRRDFETLMSLGMARRFHGGICLSEGRNDPALPIALRQSLDIAVKMRLAEAAARELPEAGAVFIDGGTTTACLAPFLDRPNLHVITKSVALLKKFDQCSTTCASLTMTGGEFNRTSELLLGSETLHTLSTYHAELAVISGTALDEDFIYDNREDASDVQRCMANNSNRLVIIADSSKFGRKAMCKSLTTSRISLLITDRSPEKYPIVEKLRQRGVRVQFAE